MALTDKLVAIGNAIRAKTGKSGKLTLDNMVTEINGITTVNDTIVEFNQMNETVINYLADADSTYTNDNSGTVVDKYASSTVNHDDPTGYSLTINQNGIIYFIDETNQEDSFSDSVSIGTYTVYNLIPNHVYRYIAKDANDKTFLSGRLKATGHVRQIYTTKQDNCRDLGGWDADGGVVRYGLFYRGIDPFGYPAIINVLADRLGIKQEIDFQAVTSYSKNYTPYKGGIGVNYNRFPYDETYYKDMVNLSGSYAEQTAEALTFMMENAIKGVPQYFHCSAGADRTGTIAYMLLGMLGVKLKDCDKDYELTGITGVIYDGSAVNNRTRNAHPKAFREYIKGLTSSGSFNDGVFTWMAKAGMDDVMLNAFRQTMIDGSPSMITLSDYLKSSAGYTNQIPISIDTDGSIYDGDGKMTGYRFNSSGTYTAEATIAVSGYIPVKNGDIIRLYNAAGTSANESFVAVKFFNAAFETIITTGYYNKSNIIKYCSGTMANDNKDLTFKVEGTGNTWNSLSYIRMSFYNYDSAIITVNEEVS